MKDLTASDLLFTLSEIEAGRHTRAVPSLDECVGILGRVLPGFWWRGGTCGLSSEVVVAPDFNCPVHGNRLLREFPVNLEYWDQGIDVEFRPGSNENLRRAFLAAILRALLAKQGEFPEFCDPRAASIGSGRTLADATNKKDQP